MKATSLFCLIACVFTSPAFAQTGQTVFPSSQEEALRNNPGGTQIGSARGGVPMKVLETRGDWLRVSVEGWVKSSNVSESKPTGGGKSLADLPVASGDSALQLLDFDIQDVPRNVAGDRARVKLKLVVKNNSNVIAKTWSGLLVVQNASGNVLLRLGVTNGQDAINPQSTGEVNYYWADNEDAYGVLTNRTKNELRVQLLQVKLG